MILYLADCGPKSDAFGFRLFHPQSL